MIQDGPTDPERDIPEWLNPEGPEGSTELELRPGERYGWWEDHEPEDSYEVATVHGAVNNYRTRILLDSGASVSMIGLDLARRLKLNLRTRDPIRVSGLGGVPTYISASARIKITLGPRIVYVMSVYVATIGEGVEILLGMNFMYAVGVRLSIRDGLVQLPDEETVVMCGSPVREHLGLDLPVHPERTLYLQPGEHAIVKIRYGQSNPQREVVWSGRGDRWVTQIIYAATSWATAVKVVNISSKMVWIDTRTAVARIVEFGWFPSSGRYVRPGRPKYNEWQQLIYESAPSFKARRRAKELERSRWSEEPPCVPRPEREWPKKLLLRPRSGTTEVRFAALRKEPVRMTESRTNSPMRDMSAQTLNTVNADTQTGIAQESPAEKALKVEVVAATSDLANEDEDESETVLSEPLLESELPDAQDKTDDDDEIEDCPSKAMLGTPLYKLEQEYARCMRVSLEDQDLEPAVYIHEGSELMSQLRDELALLPELKDLSPECNIAEADVGVPGCTTSGEERKMRSILERHRTIFLGDGNAAPAPARGVVCDLDVGDAKPVAQRARSIAPHVMMKVYELLKKLLETKLIENSDSPWASPIVIVLKKNGVDIRMCIDYRIVNGFIKLSNYPLPLIDDLLIGFERAMWFMSLDMASGFWAVTMTERAKLISAFVCPFGHFQWTRMPFGLKNAPLVYQAVIDNCLWGFVRLPPDEEKLVDPDVLEFLGLDPNERSEFEREESGSKVPILTDQMTVFQRNIPTPSQMGPILGRSSYIDDIAHGAPTWDELCADLNTLIFRLRYWNITVSLPKSEFGKKTIPYLSHEISAEGLRAVPKIAKGVQNLPFPKTLKGVQSFLGSLNYYHKFIEDFPVVAAVLYELTDEQVRAGRDLSRAKESFEILKRKIVSTPLLRHPDRTKPYVIIPHATKWAACAVLGQEYDGVIQPVRFTGRVLNESEVRYHIAEKEAVAIMRVLDVFRTIVENCHIVVYTRYSVLSWLMKSKSADGRCVRWGLTLSHWDLEVRKVQRDEDGLPAILGAGITPREHLDEVAEDLIPAKGRVKAPPVISVEMLNESYSGYVLSFDGAAKTSTRQGSCGCVIWRLPGWHALSAYGFALEDVTVNDAEYHSLLKGLALMSERDVQDLVVVGDSRIVIQQTQGLINCSQPNLQRRLAEYEALKVKFKSIRLVHVKRDYSQAADYLTSKTLVLGESWQVEDADELRHLEQVSKIHEKLMKSNTTLDALIKGVSDPNLTDVEAMELQLPGPESAPLPVAARVMAAVVTRNQSREQDSQRGPMNPLEYQEERWRRIKAHQELDPRLKDLKRFLNDELDHFSRAQIRKLSKKADLYAVDVRGVLYRLSRSTRDRPRDMSDELRLVVPDGLRTDMLHYAHEDFQGGHQGVTRTFEKLRSEFYWRSMYADVQRFVEECVDCASGKGRPPNPGPSPGNIEPRRPFEAVSMDFVTHMPRSVRGNTFLLLFQDMFSGYVMCKPMDSTTAQDVAEAYEERVFRSFGASSMIRHDQDPRFMSEVFTRFRELLGSRQRATLAYRTQANGQQERSVQTVMRSVKAYVAEADQTDWDDHAERLMFALNTSYDATRLDTPFYLVHGWDAQGTVSAMLGPKPSSVPERTAYKWRRKFQRDYGYALACAKDLQKKAKRARSAEQTRKWKELSERIKSGFEVGDAVWLYIPKVQTGLSRKLAHLWHGPFRIEEMHDDFRVKLKVEDTGYRVNPWVHVSRLKPRALYPRRPTNQVDVEEDDDFDAALLPEDSWEADNLNDEYEVEKILDLRWSKRTRTSRRLREYLVKWKGYDDAEWIPMTQLNCGALLYEFNQGAKARARFRAMQAGDDHPRV